MKKALIFLIISLLALDTYSQSSSILPNGVELPKFSSNPACTVAEKGRLIFNTTANKSYYCDGTTWVDMSAGGLTLPYSSSGNAAAPNILFNVSNSSNGRAITGETTSSTYGIGVYGASTNIAPSSASPSTVGIFGINNSQNANGSGIYGQHDGTGKGIYGVVKNSGIGVYGLGLPVGSGGSGSGIGVKGESTNNYGVYGTSTNDVGVYGFSTNADGIKGISNNQHGGHFESSSSSNPALYVSNSAGGNAADFVGNVSMSGSLSVNNNASVGNNLTVNTLSTSSNLTVGNNLTVNNNAAVDGSLTVNNGKGVAYNSASSTNLKIYTFTTATFGAVLPGFGLSAEGAIAFVGGFTGTPRVFVGDIDVTGGSSGELYRVQLQLYGCSTTSGTTTCKARLLNTSPNAVNYTITWNCMAIGN